MTNNPARETLFSTRRFAEAVVAALPKRRVVPVLVPGSNPPRWLYGVQRTSPIGTHTVELAPFGLYAHPGWDAPPGATAVAHIWKQLRSLRTERIIWNVRFDHAPLAELLCTAGLRARRSSTLVIALDDSNEGLFARFSATTRNQVRRAASAGVVVRPAATAADVERYYDVYARLTQQRGGFSIVYPIALVRALSQIGADSHLLLAEYKGLVVAGGLFFVDGESVLYWHGAADRAFSQVFPSFAVVNHAIRLSRDLGARSFNLGASNGIPGLERFKASWGAASRDTWSFTWTNPVLAPVCDTLARGINAVNLIRGIVRN